jgi:GSH-dependent disulfide-bond oxidoreductase
LLDVIENQLKDSPYIATNDISIADFALAPWVACLGDFYKANEILELKKFEKTKLWLDKIKKRPGVQRGWNVCPIKKES